MKEFSYEEIKIATDGFSPDRLVGKGSHGSVYKGILVGGVELAIKKPSSDAAKLDNEIDILSSVRSTSIVNLVGICHGPTHKLLVTELMPNGSLHDLLHSPSSTTPPSWPRRLLIALQVACSVLSLHEADPCIIHRDVKPANVMFDKRRDARLGDFSLAVRAGERAVPAAGTLGYLDPGYTAPHKLSAKNDVFSFGVLLLEIVSSRRAMDMGRDPASIVSWAVPMVGEGRARDVCDGRVAVGREMEGLVARVLVVAARCVAVEEERRPAMVEVVGELGRVVERACWSSWLCMRSVISMRVDRCGRAWRMRNKKRVTGTTKIVCKHHLRNDEDDDLVLL